MTFAPPDVWSRQKDTGRTMAELFMAGGVPIVRADNNRVQGPMLVKELLLDRPDGRPGILFFDCCRELIADIQAILADEANPSDCARQPHELTHTVDALRYFCVSRTLPAQSDVSVYREPSDAVEYDVFLTGGELRPGYFNF